MGQTHLIVGAGNMGGALLSSWLKSSLINPKNVAILDPSPGVEAVYAIERGAKHLGSVEDIPKNINTVLLSIKPQLFPEIRRQLVDVLNDDTLILSIMAGVSLKALDATFHKADVVRAMPNMPAAIGQGITAYVANATMDKTVIKRAEALLAASGKVIRVDTDDQINAVTAVSGSGPAYLFHLCETLANAGKAVGLSPETAAKLARETIIGASALMADSDKSPTDLREAVTSPGGTTQAALDVLMDNEGQEQLMRKAVKAAFERARELSN